ncbi:response regulator [Micromonospora eburnea]|uniref:Two component transcriptional regulator, LuxR family n=1 Tax=Micromonospora eburnea TaxID=227316 RepID=A0A1C6UJR0_9ACTN|nr:response regulator transcription factor [Micromonospora eburnea]SCL54093.1 two component transcriptional regulator, LuxR family [Micromonospora eburnea]
MTLTVDAAKVVLVDDHLLLRQSLASLIDADPHLAVVGQASDGIEAIDTIGATRPDVVLMDVRMPRLDGIEATRRLCRDANLSHTRVLVLSMFELDEYVYQAIRAGASGFLLKDTRPNELLDAIKRTHAGESLFAPAILTRLIEHYISIPPQSAAQEAVGRLGANLTGRETQILELIGRGLSNEEISRHLTISIKTVKTHVSHLLSKLSARDRTHLVIAAYDAGLVRPRHRNREMSD